MSDHQMSTIALSELAVGASCYVASVELEGLLRRRILDLGMVPGTPIRCVRKSPAGDPIAYAVRGSTIALRTDDARLIRAYLPDDTRADRGDKEWHK
ncbi:FeoA family protein [Sporomusa sp.]|uniref:FeoA family protein n=1 Tax=Sporomusa sp. TaxID=2078658 RepID=UPI002BE4FE52|nr:FeoA family protein [Sporomusa sp.]HWR41697.1 FeoA family protein [Sporomusa sp.]